MIGRRYKTTGCWLLTALAALLAAAGILVLVRAVPGIARFMVGTTKEPTALPAQSLNIQITAPTLTPQPRPTSSSTADLATISPLPTPAVTDAPQREWIAFESKRGRLGDYEICVMATDGSQLANLTGSWADDVAPAWSPDGRYIAFVSLRDTLTGKSDLEGGNLYVLPFDPVAGRASGEAARLTAFEGAEGWPAWSPDGTRIAFHADIDGQFDIWVMNVDGTGLQNLTEDPAEDRYPAWSPDGSLIAFASTREGDQYDVYIMEAAPPAGAARTEPVNITNNPARDRYPIWSPDGTRLTFNTDRPASPGDTGGKQDIYIMHLNLHTSTVEGVVENLTRTPRSDEGLADWSPDGNRVVLYSEQKHDKDIYIVDVATGEWSNLTNSPSSDEYCAWWP